MADQHLPTTACSHFTGSYRDGFNVLFYTKCAALAKKCAVLKENVCRVVHVVRGVFSNNVREILIILKFLKKFLYFFFFFFIGTDRKLVVKSNIHYAF